MTRLEEIKERHDAFDVQYFYPGSGRYFGEADADMQWLIARNEELQRRVEKMQAVVDAAKAAAYEYFHPATGDGDTIRKMHRLRDSVNALDAKEQDDD